MTPYHADPLVTLYLGDCLDVMRELPDASVDAVVTDPPYGIGFMGKEWDTHGGRAMKESTRQAQLASDAGWTKKPYGASGKPAAPAPGEMMAYQSWCEAWAREAFRVAKPGAYLLAFGGTRTVHRLACAIEDAGWEIRDQLEWIYSAGFPKSRRLELDLRFCQCSEGIAAAARSDASTGHAPSEDGRTSTEHASGARSLGAQSPNAKSGKRRAVGFPGGYQLDHGFGDGQPLQVGADALAPVPSPADAPARSRSTGQGDDQEGREPSHSRSSDGRIGHPSTTDSPDPGSVHPATPLDNEPSTGWTHPSTATDTAGTPARIAGIGTSLSAWPHCTTCGKPKGNGFGSALKPAHEPIVMARKPLVGNLATNALRYGTGALNIGATRIGTADGHGGGAKATSGFVEGYERGDGFTASTVGRWPSNVLLSDPELFDEPNPAIIGSGSTEDGAAGYSRFFQIPGQPLERFWSKVNKSGDCWEWTGHRTAKGYGRFVVSQERRSVGSHRVAWELTNGPIPEGMAVLHRCDNPPCVRPDHLFLGTHQDNMDDMVAKGRARSPDIHGADRYNAKLTDDAVRELRQLRSEGWELTALGERFGITPQTASKIATGKSWAHVTDEPDPPVAFIIPKSDRAERERGLAGRPKGFTPTMNDGIGGREHSPDDPRAYRANTHPTVKPIDLMRHLVRLVTPPGGVCLDPFLGSGTTALAASEEGMRCIGIEREREYLDIAVGRLIATPMGLGLDVGAPVRRDIGKQRGNKDEMGRPTLGSNRDKDRIWAFFQDDPDEEPAA